MRILTIIIVAASLGLPGLAADDPHTSTPVVTNAPHPNPEARPPQRNVRRRHMALVDQDGVEHYEVTEIQDQSKGEEDRHVLLVADARGGKYVFERTRSYLKNRVTWRIADPKRESYVEVGFDLPDLGPTAEQAFTNGRAMRDVLAQGAVVKLETNGGAWEALDGEWADWHSLRELRSGVRPTLSPLFLEGLERMRNTLFATPEAQPFYNMVGRLVLHDAPEPAAIAAVRGHAFQPKRPDCGFDASLGMPCTAEQARRLEEELRKEKLH